MKLFKRILKSIFVFLEIGILLIAVANVWVYSVTGGRTYTKVSKIPPRNTALVLGTSPKMKSGISNPYFTARMEATSLLYHHGKIKKIIVSGEKSEGYDEPAAMKKYLVYQEGVPEHVITMDPYGFNTQKSIIRCKKIYHRKNIVIVSQGFHNLRALFFARNINMDALAFDARDVSKPKSFFRNQIREIFARVQAVVYFIFRVSPD